MIPETWGEKLRNWADKSGPLLATSAAVALFLAANWYFFRPLPQELALTECSIGEPRCAPKNEEEVFKYGSLGGEAAAGIPYKIFVVLPEVFPELLPGPGGYRSFGLPWEEGRILPVGFSLSTLGIERVTQNCAVCHTTSYRVGADSVPQFAPAGPGNMTNLGGLLTFLQRASNDAKFDGDHLIAAMQLKWNMSPLEEGIYRSIIIPYLQSALQEQTKALDWRHALGRAEWGPGRDGSMNLARLTLLEQVDDGAVDNSDFPAIWNLGGREGHLLDWAGETSDLMTFIRDSAFGVGARPGPEFEARMQAIRTYLIDVQPPEMPKELHDGADLQAAGKVVFDAHCADCHGAAGERTGTAIPIDEIGTDPNRFNTWTPRDDELVNAFMEEQGVERVPMRKQGGYVAVPLDGLWLRGPYLHNGSVPTIAELLKVPARRVSKFYRGCDVVDAKDLGFVWALGDATQTICPLAFEYDTKLRGNGNGGHDYGTALSETNKNALIAYLKTL